MTSRCADVREAVSARLDGEDPGLATEEIDAHLDTCEACRAWAASARIALAQPPVAPDLTASIMAAVAELRPSAGLHPSAELQPSTELHPSADVHPSTEELGPPAALPDGPATRHRPGRPAARRRGRWESRRVRTAAVAAAVVLVAGTVGVVAAKLVRGGSSSGLLAQVQQVAGSTQASSRYPGATVLPVTLPKPDLLLTDTSGQSYDLAARTAGKVTLVYFGYTHCPDVCPLNMALTADALAKLPTAQARQVDVVFVSTDPARDTPVVIRSWLDNFSRTFVGLTGSIAAVHAAERTVEMAASYPEKGDTPAQSGGYQIVHSGYTIVYAQDGGGHLQVDQTAQPAQFATTLEHLVTKGFQA